MRNLRTIKCGKLGILDVHVGENSLKWLSIAYCGKTMQLFWWLFNAEQPGSV